MRECVSSDLSAAAVAMHMPASAPHKLLVCRPLHTHAHPPSRSRAPHTQASHTCSTSCSATLPLTKYPTHVPCVSARERLDEVNAGGAHEAGGLQGGCGAPRKAPQDYAFLRASGARAGEAAMWS